MNQYTIIWAKKLFQIRKNIILIKCVILMFIPIF